MCLVTKQTEPTILTEDMIVYKILKDDIIDIEGVKTSIIQSPVMNFTWCLDTLYTTTIKECKGSFYDAIARHKNLTLAERDQLSLGFYTTVEFLEFLGFKMYGEGYHSAKTHDRLSNYTSIFLDSIYECTIPAGSMIFEDNSGLIISNRLIINKKLKHENI